MTRVGFLFNHDAAHQVMHAAPAAFALAHRYLEIEVRIFVTTAAEAEAVAQLEQEGGESPAQIERLEAPAIARRLDRLTGNAFLVKRFGVLRRHRARFADLDMLVAPDKTCLVLKRWLGARCPRLVHVFHGAGDRAGGFQGVGKFDFCLLPGPKYEARLLEEGRLRPGHYAVAGYPKLERYADLPSPVLFESARPTVLYTPHFDPRLSSWYKWGPGILRWFAQSQRFNLIFAPHVLLFRRRWHISTEGGLPKRTPAIPAVAYEASNILVDKGSRASVDMTYTRAADIYLGDMSSQVYEFLSRPRPCIFLDCSLADWRNSPDFRCWRTGEVVSSPDRLPAALERALADPDRYRDEQERAFSEAFDLNATPSAVRAADALAEYLGVISRRAEDAGPVATVSAGLTPRR